MARHAGPGIGPRGRRAGFTLIELLVALVIFAAALSGVLAAFLNAGVHSADPMIRAQALSIAQAYLDEIMLKHYADPDGAGGEARPDFDDILDYHGLSEAPTDQFGVGAAGLAGYRVVHPGGVDLRLAAHRGNL